MRLDLQSLHLFLSIAHLRSIAKTAECEFIAASAISKRIATLESELNTKLLYRLRRGVALTPAGQALVHHASSIFSSIEQLETELSEYAEGIRGHVRILANISSIIQFLPEDLGRFAQQYPEIKIDLREDSTPHIIRSVTGGLADIGIISTTEMPTAITTEPYRHDVLALVVPLGHPLCVKRSTSFREALEYDFVGLHKDSGWHVLLSSIAREAGKQMRIRVRVPSFDAVFRMVQAHLGISVAPEGVIEADATALTLRAIDLDEPWAHRTLHMCFRDFGSLPVPAKLFVDHLRAVRADLS